jgi:LemA protein
MAIIIALVIIAVLIIGYIHYFNKLQVLKNNAAEAESGIDVQLKRRADLIPNLVESVRGYATHESTVFKSATDARASLLHAIRFKTNPQHLSRVIMRLEDFLLWQNHTRS